MSRQPVGREDGQRDYSGLLRDPLAFYETDEIGKGPVLHIHPYAETFILIEGRALYQIGETVIEAQAGDILTAPVDAPHRFSNLGPGRLRTVDIHHSPEWIQTDLE